MRSKFRLVDLRLVDLQRLPTVARKRYLFYLYRDENLLQTIKKMSAPTRSRTRNHLIADRLKQTNACRQSRRTSICDILQIIYIDQVQAGTTSVSTRSRPERHTALVRKSWRARNAAGHERVMPERQCALSKAYKHLLRYTSLIF